MAYKRKVKQAAKRRQSVRFNIEFDRSKCRITSYNVCYTKLLRILISSILSVLPK